jgi:hypothetical protein
MTQEMSCGRACQRDLRREKHSPTQVRLGRNAYFLDGVGCGTFGTPTTTHDKDRLLAEIAAIHYRESGIREYFARAPDSDIWVLDGDLPDATRDAIRKRFENTKDAIISIDSDGQLRLSGFPPGGGIFSSA